MARKRQRDELENRLSRGQESEEARFPATPAKASLPKEYADALGAIKQRIQEERLRVILAANAAMISLYWDIGQMILERQVHEGWGAKVIDRLAADLREAFPDMKGFSPRNLKYMRAFAAAWPERGFVQQADKAETDTGLWDYPPAAKFDRLLRHVRVPIGLLTNRREVRLIYAPHGESSGSLTFRLNDMASVGGPAPSRCVRHAPLRAAVLLGRPRAPVPGSSGGQPPAPGQRHQRAGRAGLSGSRHPSAWLRGRRRARWLQSPQRSLPRRGRPSLWRPSHRSPPPGRPALCRGQGAASRRASSLSGASERLRPLRAAPGRRRATSRLHGPPLRLLGSPARPVSRRLWRRPSWRSASAAAARRAFRSRRLLLSRRLVFRQQRSG
ncbi:MAG: hypothetical protein JF614_31210 [Acidobacteria bacterium]|nr:hypothetical protein [Acidobacteriota bacterium]